MPPLLSHAYFSTILKYCLLVGCCLLMPFISNAQAKYTISGYVKDGGNGESLFSATILVKETGLGTTTNEYGFYSITLPAGEYNLVVSYLGFQSKEMKADLTKGNQRLNVELGSSAITTDVVEITGKRRDANVQSSDMGKVEMSIEEIKQLPALLGEVDVMRTLQLLPGVMSAGEGNSGFYVRGGGPDQNLVILDDAVVYNTGHLFGFFSVFNADAIKNTTLIKGGMPAQYGGRLSSVIDLQMKEGNMKKFQVDGGIGLIASRLTIQGPIKKDRASFIVSGRRTYIDLITKPILKRVEDGKYDGNGYYFYDVNMKFNYRFGDKDRLYASGYFGRDVFVFKDNEGAFSANIPWGNQTATLRWNHLFSSRLFMNTTVIYNDYKFALNASFQDVNFSLSSGITDASAKMDFDLIPNQKNKIKFGAIYTYHIFTPYTASGNFGDVAIQTDKRSQKHAHEAAIYIQDEVDITTRLRFNFGIRGSLFSQVGPLDKKVFNENGVVTDTLHYERNDNIATYVRGEPRMNMRFLIDETSSIKAGVTVNNQYIHLVSSSSTTLPTDLWVPSTQKVKPQMAIQYSVGYFRNFKKNMFETSIELYYKDMFHQIEYGQSFSPELNIDVEEGFVFGRGHSYGAEFFFKKALGKLNGWIGYTLAWTNRKFPDINDGNRFPAKYDRRHDLSVVVMYDVNKRWRVAATFVYGTGQNTTLPIGRYFINGKVVNEYGDRNSYRMAPYHRMDISATYIFPKTKFYSDITVSIYNAYNRMNPYFIYYSVKGNVSSGDLKVQAKQSSLFPVLPSLTWNFKF
ncbi:TonB-dependent receptor [soil metagenome]